MTTYNFGRLSVLLVEDNRFVRSVLEDILRHFQFGHVASVQNGAEAIEYLKTLGKRPHAASVAGLDMIVSDLVMSPINGLLLLRWVRVAKESPNRFTPFVMLSGAADQDYVRAARDLGANEFLAKPFSAMSVYKRILEVIDFPRPFITTHNYFGPDRRRKSVMVPEGEDQRQVRECDLTIVYSPDKVVKPKGPSDVWHFRLPNRLKEKVSGGVLGSGRGVGELPAELLEQAEQQLERAALDFTNWALDYLGQLSNLCTEALMLPGRRQKQFEEINLLAHELRGQGGTFGYPLISVFGKMLYDATGEGCGEDDSAVEIVKAHIDTMRIVLRDKITGDGGPLGRELHKALKQAIAKKSTSPPLVAG